MRAINADSIDEDLSLSTTLSVTLLEKLKCPRERLVYNPICDEHFAPKFGIKNRLGRHVAFVHSTLEAESVTMNKLAQDYQSFLARHILNVPVFCFLPNQQSESDRRAKVYALSSTGIWEPILITNLPQYEQLCSRWYHFIWHIRRWNVVKHLLNFLTWMLQNILQILVPLITAGLIWWLGWN